MEISPVPALLEGCSIEPEPISKMDMRRLVQEHFEEMVAMSAPEVTGALQVGKFNDVAITLYGMRQSGRLLACGALKDLRDGTAEIKTMRVVSEARGRGIGGLVLDYLVAEAARQGNHTVFLETGSEDFFIPARGLYLAKGFKECGPFADYRVDPHSVFMQKELL